MKRFTVVLLAVLALATAADAAPYDQNTDANVKATILLVGDSNINRGANEITLALLDHQNGYVPTNISRSGMGIRGYSTSTNDASLYWQIKLAQVLPKIAPDAIIIDLGANDTATLGTAPDTTGYGWYAAKIDYLIALLPNIPIFWTTLPCPLELAAYRAGCNIINTAIENAPARHANLTVVRWDTAALGHPEYMGTAPHYTSAGYTAWSNLVVSSLDAQFP